MEAKDGWSICNYCSLHYLAALTVPRYGMVLAKDKNEEEAMQWLLRSVQLVPMNWGCWLEMTSLISRVEDVDISLFFANNIANNHSVESDFAPSAY